ncbi:MAG TPA: response regulator [Polyangium sp.]|nr:response regulator [Polyangium sp.]
MVRVLIVDDEENQRKVLSIGLKLEGFEVVAAASGDDALQLLAGNRVDVALVDLMIPGMNGLEVSRQIVRRHPDIRVLLASAYHLSARQMERADCGASGFIPKPYKLADLCNVLRAKPAAAVQATC